MRFSPVLFAVFAASAALGLAQPAEAKTSEPAEPANGSPELATGLSGSSGTDLAESTWVAVQPASSAAVDRVARDARQPVSPPETTPAVEFLASLPQPSAAAQPVRISAEPPTQTTSRLGAELTEVNVAQAATPEQETTPAAPTEPTEPPGQTPVIPIAPDVTLPTTPDSTPDTPSNTTPETPETTPDTPETLPGTAPDGTAPDATTPSQPPAVPGAPETTPPESSQPEARVLVAEVAVAGAEGDLLNQVYGAIRTQPGQTTTRSQLQSDINAIFATGFFANVRAVPQDTPLGVRITFEVQPNPELSAVRLSGSQIETIRYQDEDVPLQQAVDSIFGNQYGSILNLNDFQRGVQELNELYQSNGYVLAQVVGAPQVSPDGTATIEVAEGVIENIEIRFLDRDGNATDDEGNPIDGKTRDFIITREFETKPGDVLNQQRLQADFQRAFALGIFEDLQPALVPSEEDPRRVNLIVNVTERRTGSIGASVGFSSADGLFGAVSLQEQNLGGNAQTLNAEAQVGLRSLQFDVSFTDPWIATDPNRTSYTVNAFGRQSISLVFDGGENEVELPDGDDDNDDGDRPRVYRLGSGVTFGRPLGNGWRGSLGLQYQNVSIRDASGDIAPRDELGNLLSFNESGTDNILSLQAAVVRDRRNSPLNTTSGSLLRLSDEQTIPIDGITFNRLRASYSYFIPVEFTQFAPACREEDSSPTDCPETLAFNVQGGTIIGDLPPYEAFSLGGTDSVRGYQSGELGSGRSFLTFSAEYRFPLFSILGGALFFDAGTDLGTASDVPGNPAGIRDKPGSGFGYGAGLRINSPIGQIRVDYAINDQGDNEFHFGIGQRF